jgi:hypothetical protein
VAAAFAIAQCQPRIRPTVATTVPADASRELSAGYLDLPALRDSTAIEDYVVAPGLGDLSGVLGAAELARLTKLIGMTQQGGSQ